MCPGVCLYMYTIVIHVLLSVDLMGVSDANLFEFQPGLEGARLYID